jgi:WD40 repeat protein
MTDVFISYSRRDLAFARLIHECFEESQLTTWIDWKDIPPAEDWLKEVYTAIEQADTFVFIISHTSVASEVCRLEIAHAQENHKRIIPVVVHDLGAKAINEFFPTLSALNWIFFLCDREFHLAQAPIGLAAGEAETASAIPQEPQFRRAMQLLTQAIQLDQGWLKQHTRLQVRALEWERSGREGSYLLHGKDLEQAESWLGNASGKDPQPTPLQTQYLLASRKAATRRQRMTLGAVAFGLVLSVALGIFAWISRSQAVTESHQRATAQVEAENAGATAVSESRVRATAEAKAVSEAHSRATAQAVAVEQRDTALARQMAAQSSARQLDSFDLSLLLAVESSQTRDTVEGRARLAADLQAYPALDRYLYAGSAQTFMALAISPDGKIIAAGGNENTILLWDALSGQQIGSPLQGHTSWIESLVFSPDNRMLVSSDLDGGIMYWDISQSKMIRQVDSGYHYGGVLLAMTPDGELLINGNGRGEITTWEAATGQRRASWQVCEAEGEWVSSIAASPRDGLIAAACSEGQIRFWDPVDGEPIGQAIETYPYPENLTFSADGSKLAFSAEGVYDAGGYSRLLWLWDVDRQSPLNMGPYASQPLQHPQNSMASSAGLAFSPDGKYLVSGYGTTVQLWNTANGEEVGKPLSAGAVKTILDLRLSPDGGEMITIGDPGKLIAWKFLALPPLVEDRLPYPDWPHLVSYVPAGSHRWLIDAGCGKLAESGGTCVQGEISLWDLGEETPQRTPFSGTFAEVTQIAVSADGKQLASGHTDGEVRLWDVNTQGLVQILPDRHGIEVSGLSFSPDGRWFASSGLDGSLYLWDIQQDPLIRHDLHLRDADNEPGAGYWAGILAVQFTPDSQTLVEAGYFRDAESGEEKIKLWDVAGKKVRGELSYVSDSIYDDVNCIAISPDGKTLAAASLNYVRLFDLLSGQALPSPVTGQGGTINAIAFSPDGRMLASGGEDKTLTLWDVLTLQVVTQLGQFDFYTDSLSISPDGLYLVSTGDLRQLHIWKLGLEAWQSLACQIAHRNFTGAEWLNYLPDIPYHKTCPANP